MFERAINQTLVMTSSVDPITTLTVVLTALAVLLGVVTIGIAALAIWGYSGIRDSVKEMAFKRVDEAMAAKLKEYPAAQNIIALTERLREQADFIDKIRNQVVTTPEPKSVAKASNSVVQLEQPPPLQTHVGAPETPLESTEEQVTPIEPYPGEEEPNVDDDGTKAE